MRAENRASKVSGTGSAAKIATGSGRKWALRPSRSTSRGQSLARSTWATWPSAWTPASVRPAPPTKALSPLRASSAVSIASCTESPFFCRCQPAKGEPSYSMLSLNRGIFGQRDSRALANARATQKSSSLHWPLAWALHLNKADRFFAAGNRQAIIKDEAWRPLGLRNLGAQDPYALRLLAQIGRKIGGGKRRKTADMIVHVCRRPTPVDLQLLFVDFWRVARAAHSLRGKNKLALVQSRNSLHHEHGPA